MTKEHWGPLMLMSLETLTGKCDSERASMDLYQHENWVGCGAKYMYKDITEVVVVCLGVNCINKYVTNGKLIITAWNIRKWNSNIVTFLPPRYLMHEYMYFVALKLIKLSYLWGFLLCQSKTKVWDPLEMKTLGFLSWAPQITYFITQR